MSEDSRNLLKDIPYFDVEFFMDLAQETRLGGEVMNRLIARWEDWGQKLTAHQFTGGKIPYLLVWLPESVEDDVDNMWDKAPSDAHLYNTLAQALLMTAVHTLIPEVEEAGCAPAPKPTEDLRKALEAEGVPYNLQETALSRRYAVVTHYPFRGACEICYLRPNCPKGGGAARQQSEFEIAGFTQEHKM